MSEAVYNLMIDEKKVVVQDTGVIKGKLNAFLVSSDKPIQLQITVQDNPGIRLLELNNFQGDRYVAVRTPCNDFKGDIYNYQVDEIALNDVLIIQAQGVTGAKIQVKIRMED